MEQPIGILSILLQREKVTVLFDPVCRWRLVEEYGTDRFTVEPEELREQLRALTETLARRYRGD